MAITAVIVATLLLIAGSLVVYKHSQAAPEPLPASLDVSGTNLSTVGPIQVPGGNFTVTYDYTPLNGNGSVMVLSSDKQIIDYRNNHADGSSGTFTIDGYSTGPIYILTYGSTWHVRAH